MKDQKWDGFYPIRHKITQNEKVFSFPACGLSDAIVSVGGEKITITIGIPNSDLTAKLTVTED
jgi:hypothetical protein